MPVLPAYMSPPILSGIVQLNEFPVLLVCITFATGQGRSRVSYLLQGCITTESFIYLLFVFCLFLIFSYIPEAAANSN